MIAALAAPVRSESLNMKTSHLLLTATISRWEAG
jgi:hypothetical protein